MEDIIIAFVDYSLMTYGCLKKEPRDAKGGPSPPQHEHGSSFPAPFSVTCEEEALQKSDDSRMAKLSVVSESGKPASDGPKSVQSRLKANEKGFEARSEAMPRSFKALQPLIWACHWPESLLPSSAHEPRKEEAEAAQADPRPGIDRLRNRLENDELDQYQKIMLIQMAN